LFFKNCVISIGYMHKKGSWHYPMPLAYNFLGLQ